MRLGGAIFLEKNCQEFLKILGAIAVGVGIEIGAFGRDVPGKRKALGVKAWKNV